VSSSASADETDLPVEERLRILSEAMRLFTEATTDLQGLLDTVARRVAEVVKDTCIVRLLSDDGRTLLLAAAFDSDPEALRQVHDAFREPFLIDTHPVSRRVFETGEPFFAPKLDPEQLRPPRTTARYFDLMQGLGMHSVLIVALRVHDRSIGQLTLARSRPDSPAFDQHDLDLAQNLAAYAAFAISNARLLSDARRETAERKRITERFRILAEASHEFSEATYDHHRLLEVVATRLGQLFGDMCVIRAVTEDGEWLESAGAAYHRDPDLLVATREVMLSGRQRVGEGISGRVAATGRALLTPRIDPVDFTASSEPKYRPYLERLQITSSMTLPLLCRGKVVGIANLMRGSAADPYTEDDLQLVERIADHAALAIANARSYAAERTARDAAEKAASDLRKAEGRFARLSDSGLIGIVVSDLDGHVSEINDALLGLLDYNRDDILSGRTVWKDLTPPSWHEVDARAIEQLAASGVGGLREKEYLRKDGTCVPVLIGSAMLEGEAKECISFVLDLSQRKAALAALELAAIVEYSDEAIIGKTLDGVVTSWNRGAEHVFGYSAAEMVGSPISVLVPAERAHEETVILEHLAKGEVERFDTVRRRKDGRHIDVSVTISPVRDAKGNVVGISKVARDITDRRQAEESLARAKNAAEAATLELEAFSYSVAHDLRAPLRGMNGFAQVLLDTYEDRFDAEGKDWLHEILLNAHKMAALIDSLLSLSRVTRSEMTRETVDLSAICRATASQLRAAEPQRSVEIVVQEHLDAIVDPVLARALMDNLLGNAWKFTAKVPAAHIEFGKIEKAGTPAFFVRDNGAGFDMAFAKKLFAPFQRLHTVDEFPGTGIGLATVQRIVRRHGGQTWAEGAVDAGATFYFTLPASTLGAAK
jgi:PAS domain S-box-containing protein